MAKELRSDTSLKLYRVDCLPHRNHDGIIFVEALTEGDALRMIQVWAETTDKEGEPLDGFASSSCTFTPVEDWKIEEVQHPFLFVLGNGCRW